MKRILAIATMAIMCAAAHPSATIADATSAAGQRARVWNGRWEGTTVSGNQLVLILQLEGQRVTGRLIVGKQSANITYGKVVEDAFAITTSPIDGHGVDATGRYLGDAIELTIEGVKKPVTLTRVQ